MLPFERIKREVLVRRDAKTSDKFGSDPSNRTVSELINYGIININKPAGPTSHQVSAYAKEILGIKKAGHSGTLDPNVTGSLPVALGRGTRIVQALLVSGKEYICIMHLHNPVEEKKLRGVMGKFVGKIKQLPPIKSAVKRQWRFRKIYYIEILDIVEKDVLFKIGCQAGTYIRKICSDIGEELKVGAHMAELIRTKTGPFNESTFATLQDMIDALWFYKNEDNDKFIRKIIQPIENGVAHLPKVWVLDTTVDTLTHGADLGVPGISKVESEIQVGEFIAIMTLKNELIALSEARMTSKEMISLEKGIAARTSKVFMLSDTYPKNQLRNDKSK